MALNEWQLESQCKAARETIFLLLQNDGYQQRVIDILLDVFKNFPDITQHGYVLWALMHKAAVRLYLKQAKTLWEEFV